MEENTQLPKEVELITEDRLKELGFEFVDYGDNPPYETYRKGGVEVSEYNGECWLIEMLDQNNIERPIKYLSELEEFFNGCGQSIYGATAYATRLHQANEVIKVLEYDNNKLKGEVEGLKNAVEELKGQPGAVWVKGAKGFPVMKRVVAKFKHYDDPLRDWVVGFASSSTGETITFDWGVSSITLDIKHERWDMFYWLDESAVGREDAVDVDELWDEHAEYIDDNIDELVRWAGSTVVTREQFNKMMAKFKQQKEK